MPFLRRSRREFEVDRCAETHVLDAVESRRGWTNEFNLTELLVGDVQRAEVWIVRWKRNGDVRVAPERGTHYLLSQPLLPLTQATLVRGAFGVDSTGASRLLTTSTIRKLNLYEKRFSYMN